MKNLIIFTGDKHHLPIMLGLFGREELVYKSIFDETTYRQETKQIYDCQRLDSTIYVYRDINDFLREPNDFFSNFNKIVYVLDYLLNQSVNEKLKKINNSKSIFVWHFGEVFEPDNIENVKKLNLDYILSGSKRPELEHMDNFNLDLLLPFRYFRYYIGYYYLEEFIKNVEIPKYDKNKPKVFSYTRYRSGSVWRNEIIKSMDDIKMHLNLKNSANDSYDLAFPKYKHFEAINDYVYSNYNLIFETIDFRNHVSFFLTEKTFKGLFFRKPFLLVAAFPLFNYLKNKGFYLVNFDFVDKIETPEDVLLSIKNFSDWIKNSSEEEIETHYNDSLIKSKNNYNILMEHLNNYEDTFNIFGNLLK